MKVSLIKVDVHWELITNMNPIISDNNGREIVMRI